MKTVRIYCGGMTQCFVEMLLRNINICNKGDIVDICCSRVYGVGIIKYSILLSHISEQPFCGILSTLNPVSLAIHPFLFNSSLVLPIIYSADS